MTARRVGVVTGLLLAALLVPAAPAQAAYAYIYDNVLDVLTVTSDGAGDTLVFTCSATNVAVNGVALSTPAVPCAGVAKLNVNGGAGNDVIDTTGLIRPEVNLDGGDGDDSLTGAEGGNPSTTSLNATGGPGNDLLRFPTGDSIAGGDGDDTFAYLNTFHSPSLVLQGQGGTDTYRLDLSGTVALNAEINPLSGGLAVNLGGGFQIIPWGGMEAVDFSLTDGNETIRLGAFAGRGRVDGRSGNDVLLGGDGADTLIGGLGDDTVDGGAGADGLDGGDGNDLMRSRDVFADSVVCGAGSDIAVVDGADTTSSCETKDVGSSTDATKPKPKFSGAKVSGTKLKLKAACPDELRCVGLAKLGVKGKRNGANLTVKLGDVLILVDGGRKKGLTLALTAAQRQAVNGLTKPKLTIAYDLIDAGGNVGKGKKSIKLKT